MILLAFNISNIYVTFSGMLYEIDTQKLAFKFRLQGSRIQTTVGGAPFVEGLRPELDKGKSITNPKPPKKVKVK